MRSFIRALGILCIVNMLALLALGGWLLGTERLTPERLHAIRAMLSSTAAEEQSRLAAESDERQQMEAEQARLEREANPDPPADLLVDRQARSQQAERDRRAGLAAELDHLRSQIHDAQQSLAAERKALEAERSAWEATRKNGQKQVQDEQFQRVVRLLETIPSTQARDTLVGLMRDGQINDAVAYLNAMKPFSASKVLRAFKGDEQPLATELLQRMRALGEPSVADAAGRSTDADTPSSGG